MANIADADAAGGDSAAGGKPAGGRKKLVMALAAVVLAGAGAGGFFYFKAAPPVEDSVKLKEPIFVDLPEMIVNLSTPADRPQFMRLKASLEVSDERLSKQIQPMLPRVVDAFQMHLRETRRSDLEGSAGLYRLKEELLRRVNQAVFPAKVDAVLFKEVLVQ